MILVGKIHKIFIILTAIQYNNAFSIMFMHNTLLLKNMLHKAYILLWQSC